jgi:hypothetical protein
MGGSHIGTGGDRYLMANRPSGGSRATAQALDDPSRENIAHQLRALAAFEKPAEWTARVPAGLLSGRAMGQFPPPRHLRHSSRCPGSHASHENAAH